LSKPLGGTTSSLSRQNAFDLFTRVLIRCVLLFARTRENSFSGGYASFSPTGSSLFAFVINPSYRTSGSPHSQPKRNSARTEITSHRESILYNWWFLSQQLSKRREAERISRVSLSRLWLGEINRVADKFQHKFQPDNVRTRCPMRCDRAIAQLEQAYSQASGFPQDYLFRKERKTRVAGE